MDIPTGRTQSLARLDSPTMSSTADGDSVNAEASDKSKERPSVVSLADSGYGGMGSSRSSLVYGEEQKPCFCPFETILESGCENMSTESSPGTSCYVTACTSLEASTSTSIDDEALSIVVNSSKPNGDESRRDESTIIESTAATNSHYSSKDQVRCKEGTTKSAKKMDLVEKDGPYLRRHPQLQSSQSVECDHITERPVIRRQSKTEVKFSEEDLQRAIAQLLGDRTYKELTDKHEEVLKRTMKDKAAKFRQYTDFKILHAHLVEERLVYAGESEYLNNQYVTHTEKANKFFFEILDRKGSSAYRSFFYALRAERQHKGHDDLIKVLEVALLQLELQN